MVCERVGGVDRAVGTLGGLGRVVELGPRAGVDPSPSMWRDPKVDRTVPVGSTVST